MNIYQTLAKDHKVVLGLLDDLEKATAQERSHWSKIIDAISVELISHSRAEEALVYNGIRDAGGDKEVISHSFGEHAQAEMDLRALQAMAAVDVGWTTLVQKLKHDLKHHIQEEESRVFAEGKKIFSNDEAEMLAKAFNQLKPIIQQKSMAGTTMDMIKNMLPEKLRATFKINPLEEIAQHHH